MRHPEGSEWMEWLYGEGEPARRADFEAHLAVCPECAERVDRWRTTQRILADATVPAMKPVASRSWAGVWKWAAAVALLATGIVAGRWGTVTDAELERRLSRAMDQVRDQTTREQAAGLGEMTRQTVVAMRAENQLLVNELARQLETSRAEDRAQLMTLVRDLDQRRSAELNEVRNGLGQLANRAGEALALTQAQVRWLAGALPVDGSMTETKE